MLVVGVKELYGKDEMSDIAHLVQVNNTKLRETALIISISKQEW